MRLYGCVVMCGCGVWFCIWWCGIVGGSVVLLVVVVLLVWCAVEHTRSNHIVWLCGCVVVWWYGCVVVWLLGCVVVRLCVVVWLLWYGVVFGGVVLLVEVWCYWWWWCCWCGVHLITPDQITSSSHITWHYMALYHTAYIS